MIQNIIEKFRGNQYLLQIATLMSGTLMAQLVILGFIPIMTRLYTPAEFGIYSIFFSVSTILGMVSSWKYELAIMLPKSDRDAQALVFLSFLITFGMTLLVTVVIALFYDLLVVYFAKLSFVLWLIPLAMFVFGTLQIFIAYSSRNQFYKKIASIQVANAVTTVTTQSISRYFFTSDGLVVGKIMGDLISLFLYIRIYFKTQTLQLKSISRRRVKANMKRYENFPKYQSINIFINAISQNIPSFLFLSLFSPEVVGFYALTVRVLQAPISLIGSSTKEVYYQKASKMYAKGEDIYPLYKKTTLGLLKLFILPFLIIFFFGEEIFGFIFGAEWAVSGVIAQISIVWFLFTFINAPSVVSYNILGLQKVQLQLQAILFVVRVLSIYLGFYIYDSYIASVVIFTVMGVVMNSVTIFYVSGKLRRCN